MGGAVDFRWFNRQAQTQDPLPGQTIPVPGPGGAILTNTYNGTFDLAFNPRLGNAEPCDVTLYEADADWNLPITNPVFGDPNPTGKPPDDAGRAQYEDFDGQTYVWDNNTAAFPFRVALPAADVALGRFGLLWEVLAPNGEVKLASYQNDTPGHPGHPSITGEQQGALTGDAFLGVFLRKA